MGVLVTSLQDESCYPTSEFKALYYFRWGIETFYGLIKTRLELENFTGIGAEAVKQDFFSTVYLSGLESILTKLAQVQLSQKETVYPQRVNRAVSFNAIKAQAFALLFLREFNFFSLFSTTPIMYLRNLVAEWVYCLLHHKF